MTLLLVHSQVNALTAKLPDCKSDNDHVTITCPSEAVSPSNHVPNKAHTGDHWAENLAQETIWQSGDKIIFTSIMRICDVEPS